MWQTRAVLSHLLDAVGVEPPAAEGPPEPAAVLEALRAARRRALRAVVVDWAAILLLLLLADGSRPILTLGPTQQTIFSLGLLAVAVHSGYRLGQLARYGRAGSLGAELIERDGAD